MNTLNFAFASLIAMTHPGWACASEGAAGPDQTICGTATFLAADPLVAGEAGSWSVLNGTAVFSDDHSPISQVTGLSPGDNVLQWTVLGDGPPEIDQMIVTVYDPAATVAFAGPDSVLCLPTDTMHLLAVPAMAPAIGSWSSVGIALIDLFSDPHSSVEFPSGGTVQMIWTVFNGTCGQVSDTAVITVEECIIGVPEEVTRTGVMLAFDAASRVLTLRNVPSGARLDIIEQDGRIAMSTAVRPSAEGRIPLNGLPPGIHVLRLISEGDAHVLRVVIDR
jgi:hypothetical protein